MGLYYLQNRYYNPTIGRFLNADALVSTGQGVLGNNMFAYCRNMPVSHVDVSGMYDEDILDSDNNPATKDDLRGSTASTGHQGGVSTTCGGIGKPGTSGAAQQNGSSQNVGTNLEQKKSESSSNLDRPVSPQQIKKSILKNVDVHAFKREYVGDDGNRWDLYKDTANKATIWLGNKSQTLWIQTEYIIEELLEYFQKGWK